MNSEIIPVEQRKQVNESSPWIQKLIDEFTAEEKKIKQEISEYESNYSDTLLEDSIQKEINALDFPIIYKNESCGGVIYPVPDEVAMRKRKDEAETKIRKDKRNAALNVRAGVQSFLAYQEVMSQTKSLLENINCPYKAVLPTGDFKAIIKEWDCFYTFYNPTVEGVEVYPFSLGQFLRKYVSDECDKACEIIESAYNKPSLYFLKKLFNTEGYREYEQAKLRYQKFEFLGLSLVEFKNILKPTNSRGHKDDSPKWGLLWHEKSDVEGMTHSLKHSFSVFNEIRRRLGYDISCRTSSVIEMLKLCKLPLLGSKEGLIELFPEKRIFHARSSEMIRVPLVLPRPNGDDVAFLATIQSKIANIPGSVGDWLVHKTNSPYLVVHEDAFAIDVNQEALEKAYGKQIEFEKDPIIAMDLELSQGTEKCKITVILHNYGDVGCEIEEKMLNYIKNKYNTFSENLKYHASLN